MNTCANPRLEILDDHDQVVGSHFLTRGLTIVGQSPHATIFLQGKDVSGFHLAVNWGKNPEEPLTLMNVGGVRSSAVLCGEPFLEKKIQSFGSFPVSIGSRKLVLVRPKVAPSTFLKSPWMPVSTQGQNELTIRARFYENQELVDLFNCQNEHWIKLPEGCHHKLLWVEKDRGWVRLPTEWTKKGGRVLIGASEIGKLEDLNSPQELKKNTRYRIYFQSEGARVLELYLSKESFRFGIPSSDWFPRELRKPFFLSALLMGLIFSSWMFLFEKEKPDIEEPFSVYARIQNVPIEKIDPPQTDQEPSAGGGSGSTAIKSSAPSTAAAALSGGLRNLMAGILSKTAAPSKAVLSETGGLGETAAVSSPSANRPVKLVSSGNGTNLAGAANLGALALAGSGKGFSGGTGTGLGTGASSGVGSGLGKGIGAGGFRLIEEESIVDGGLDKSVIAAVIQNNLSQIKYCYERQLVANPDLFGKVVIKWDINSSGNVEGAAIKHSTLGSPPAEQCMVGKVSGWKFPQPKNGAKVTVTYPFLFKSTR